MHLVASLKASPVGQRHRRVVPGRRRGRPDLDRRCAPHGESSLGGATQGGGEEVSASSPRARRERCLLLFGRPDGVSIAQRSRCTVALVVPRRPSLRDRPPSFAGCGTQPSDCHATSVCVCTSRRLMLKKDTRKDTRTKMYKRTHEHLWTVMRIRVSLAHRCTLVDSVARRTEFSSPFCPPSLPASLLCSCGPTACSSSRPEPSPPFDPHPLKVLPYLLRTCC